MLGTEEGAGGFARAGRDAMTVAGFQVEQVDLIERIARFAFALKDEGATIMRKIAFPTPPAFKGELTNVG
jgi:hypothetical protein